MEQSVVAPDIEELVMRERRAARERLRAACSDGPLPGCIADCINGEMVLWEGEFRVCPLAQTDACPNVGAQRTTLLAARMVQIGVGERYLEASLDRVAATIRPRIADYIEHIREHVNNGTGLLIAGGTGTGKTCILALVARAALLERIRDVAWAYSSSLMADLHSKGDDAQIRVERWRDARLALLDDFGGAYASEWGVPQFDALVEARYSRHLATCISTNAVPQELVQNPLWQRAVSRWRETCVAIGTGVDDRRGKAAAR